jgi:glycosyltransferase involved in cell wall biosynthesis
MTRGEFIIGERDAFGDTMRICIDTSPAVHRRAGLGRYAYELTSALLAADAVNQYVAFYHRPQDAHIDPPLDRLPHLTTSLDTKPWRLAALLGQYLRIPQDRMFPGIDLFHATDHLLPRLSRVKSVFTLHDLIFRLYPETHKPLNRWFLTLTMPRFLQAADAVITVSRHTATDAMRFYGLDEKKIHVIHEGVNPLFRPASTEAIARVRQKYALPDRFILSLGTIEPRKNLTALLDAYRTLRGAGSDVGLVFAGKKGWLYEGFFRRLRELGLEDKVVFTGFVPEADLPALYSAAELFVFPSLYEGFGLPVLEAMACGTAVISSNAASLPEVSGDAALLVDPTGVADLAGAIEEVLDNNVHREELEGKGPEQAGRFSWDKAAEQTLEVYRSVLVP